MSALTTVVSALGRYFMEIAKRNVVKSTFVITLVTITVIKIALLAKKNARKNVLIQNVP